MNHPSQWRRDGEASNERSNPRDSSRSIGGEATTDPPIGESTPVGRARSVGRRTVLRGLASSALASSALASGAVPAAGQQSGGPPRQMEALDRGLVAVQVDDGVLVRWRLFGTDPDDIAFNLYRDGTQVNDAPITDSTNYVDPDGTTSSSYAIRPVTDGTEGEESRTVDVWENNYLDIPVNTPEGYHPNDCSVGDLTGNGRYDIVVKMVGRQYDNTHEGPHDPVIFDAYTLEGEHLWRVDLGINVRAGAHYNPYLVYDFDGDGIAELVVRTADGTTDAAGNVIGDPNADWRDANGRILEGPEYLTVFDGETGEELATTDFRPPRGNVSDWGDDYGNRVDRFLAGVAYLDGERPSIVMGRGYYEKTMVTAFDFRDGDLSFRWEFDSADGNYEYAGQGNHQLAIADVDDDGRDEIVYGAMVLDHDGTGLYSTGWNHGDALHCGDFLPDRDGLEVYQPHEWGQWGATMRDAGTGELIWGVERDDDVGRGVAANVDPNYRGAEAWASSGIGLHTADGEPIADAPASMNHLVWWTGDLQRELLDAWDGEGVIRKWDPDNQWDYEVARFPETRANNGSKGNPCLTADILGDWREEAIWRRADDQALRLCVTPYETDHRMYTLMHDSQYRTAIAWQNVGYNQPPHPSFYVGADMDDPPTPNVELVGGGQAPDPNPEPADPPAIEPVELNGRYRIESVHSGQVLSVEGGSTADEASVVQRPYDEGADQHWDVEHLGEGVHRVENANSGSSLDVLEGQVGDGADVIQYPWHGDDFQRFLVGEDGGDLVIVAQHSNRALDVFERSTDAGANVVQWEYNGGDHQRWTFEPVDGEEGPPPIGDNDTAPTDLDDDGLYEDIDGDGQTTHDDVSAFLENIDSEAVRGDPDAFDFDGDGDIGFGDLVALLREV